MYSPAGYTGQGFSRQPCHLKTGTIEALPYMERNLRRDSIGNNPTPRLKVIGFHVEGVSSSPAQPSHLLQEQVSSSMSDTPNPVIIPPSFQACSTNTLLANRKGALTDISNQAVLILRTWSKRTLPWEFCCVLLYETKHNNVFGVATGYAVSHGTRGCSLSSCRRLWPQRRPAVNTEPSATATEYTGTPRKQTARYTLCITPLHWQFGGHMRLDSTLSGKSKQFKSSVCGLSSTSSCPTRCTVLYARVLQGHARERLPLSASRCAGRHPRLCAPTARAAAAAGRPLRANDASHFSASGRQATQLLQGLAACMLKITSEGCQYAHASEVYAGVCL